ncbi:MAG TPA: tyrosine-type recombinase/integrase [Bacteroidia bacterium]|jgi:integrase|nr:tyrosine-type recombinase/integrase [Bacteroidia bacterium]
MKTKISNTELYRCKSELGTVALKSRKNGNNPESLYLEVYEKVTQKRHLEFLNLYLTGNEHIDTQVKNDALTKCSAYVFNSPKSGCLSFDAFINEMILKIDKEQSRKSSRTSLNRLREYAKLTTIPFNKVDEKFLSGFRNWLLTEALSERGGLLEKGTSDNYLSIIMRFANRAQRKGFISINSYNAQDIPCIGKVIKVPITLTEEEIKKLQNTLYHAAPEICKALMLQFACGQRWGDVRGMTWDQIVLEGDVYKIVLKQEKTDKILPSFITKALIDWVGEGKERQGLIFTRIPKDCQTVREHLKEWCTKAEIFKKVGTHTMRRSCATILYKKGVPLYTISKILGHSSTNITLRYIGLDETDIRNGLSALKEITDSFSYCKAS